MFGIYQRLGLHVGASNRAVIRATMARFVKPLIHEPLIKARRKKIYRAMIQEHKEALALYRVAMGAM